jgi:integrase
MVTWAKTKHVGVRFWESDTRKFKGKPDRCFVIRFKCHGRTLSETVGWLSEGITAQYAANVRSEITGNIKKGEGPQSLKEKKGQEESKKLEEAALNVTLKEAFNSFLSDRTKLKPRTIKDYTGFMDTVFNDWAKKGIKDITREMVSDRHQYLGETKGEAQADQAFRFLRSLLNYCIEEKYVDESGAPIVIKNNPVLKLKKKWFRVARRETIIKDMDLPKWFKALMGSRSEVVRDYLLTITLSGLRRNEALPLEIDRVDLEEHTIFLNETKNGKPFLIPIPNYLYKVLKSRIKASIAIGSKYVFPSRLKDKHITEPQSGIDAIKEASGVEFCSHDMRRLFTTTADDLGLSPFQIKRLVNHSIPKNERDVTGGYIISDLEKLKKPMQKIEDRVLSLAGVKEKGKVVKLRS